VAVGADDHVARAGQPAFDDDLMTDALPHVEHGGAMQGREPPDALVKRNGRGRIRRRVVIE